MAVPPTGTMPAAVLTAERRLAYRPVPVPVVPDDMLLVRVTATGICGSDLATYRGRHPYKRPPVILGHEFTGTVVHTGAAMRGFEVGDNVVTAAFLHCGACDPCRRGAVNLCRHRRNLCHEGWEGSFARYVVVHPDMTFLVPPALPVATAALVEPLSIAAHALALAAPAGTDRRMVVLGSGGIGLAATLLARWYGWSTVICVDRGHRKGLLTKTTGASDYIDASDGTAAGQAVALTGGGSDVTLVCSGHPGAVQEAAAITRPGGQVIVVSYFEHPQPVDFNVLVSKELTLSFSALSTPTDSRHVIAALAAGLDPAPLVTHTFGLDQADAAMRLLDDNAGDVGKILLLPDRH